jgi:hypothetical protein
LSVAVAASVTAPLTVAPLVGAVIVTLGGVVSLTVTVKLAVLVLPAASRAVTVRPFVPVWSAMPLAVQVVVPVAVPLPPRLFAHVTCVTPTLSDAVPPSVTLELPVAYVEADVGVVIVIVGGRVSEFAVPLPVTIAELVPPFAVKLTVELTVALVVGMKRTVTAWIAPTSARLKGLPDTMLKGAAIVALPATVPPPVFETVNTWSAKLPTLTLPKFTVPVGLTAKSLRATALATPEQALSLPSESTAVTATL